MRTGILRGTLRKLSKSHVRIDLVSTKGQKKDNEKYSKVNLKKFLI